MKYDDASWHYGGTFPEDLPESAGSTHIAFFLGWCVLNGLASEYQETQCSEDLKKLRARSKTPSEWFIRVCDEKFTDEDLSAEGNAFALEYYGQPGNGNSTSPAYLSDYSAAFAEFSKIYAVPPTWESYDRLAPAIARRFVKWRAKPRWQQWIRRLFRWQS